MIVRTEEDALLFMEGEGACGGRGFCSDHCAFHGQHVAAAASDGAAVFALSDGKRHRARLHGGDERREERAA